MRNLMLFLFITIPFLSLSQNPPNCDSLIINCCSVNINNTNQLELEVANPSAFTDELYSYPGFILIHDNGDTIGLESVNYFGIGTGFQIHFLELLNPFTLPFSGTLELHSGFYDSLHCVFPFVIEATTSNTEIPNENINIYPNPARETIHVTWNELNDTKKICIEIHNQLGQTVYKKSTHNKNISIPSNSLGSSGIYYMTIKDKKKDILIVKKIFIL